VLSLARELHHGRFMPVQYLSPKELAAAIGVSESSLKRWVDVGRLTVQRTSGGHRRIPVDEAIRFVRAEGYSVRDPACFGVACCGQTADVEELPEAIYQALISGNAQQCQSLVTTAYLSGMSFPALCDGPITQALSRIGELWHHGPEGIAIEHVATNIVVQVVENLRQKIKRVDDQALVAIGGGNSDQHNLLSSLMVGVTLQEAGFQSVNLGPNTPDAAVLAAANQHKPALVWRSITGVNRPEQMAADICRLAEQLGPIPLVVGGREVHKLHFGCAKRIQVINNLSELSAFARAMMLTKALN
jgi:MerR family transcriptional regulator, light-induced transcriptional regulator